MFSRPASPQNSGSASASGAGRPMGVVLLGLIAMGVPDRGFSADTPAEMRALGRCQGCVVENTSFAGARLMGVDLGEAQISDVVFEAARLSIAVFDGAVLDGVSFRNADLRGASFVGARLNGVSFEGADLKGAVFEGAVLERTELDPALLCNTQMPDDQMDNSDCSLIGR